MCVYTHKTILEHPSLQALPGSWGAKMNEVLLKNECPKNSCKCIHYEALLCVILDLILNVQPYTSPQV